MSVSKENKAIFLGNFVEIVTVFFALMIIADMKGFLDLGMYWKFFFVGIIVVLLIGDFLLSYLYGIDMYRLNRKIRNKRASLSEEDVCECFGKGDSSRRASLGATLLFVWLAVLGLCGFFITEKKDSEDIFLVGLLMVLIVFAGVLFYKTGKYVWISLYPKIIQNKSTLKSPFAYMTWYHWFLVFLIAIFLALLFGVIK